MPDLVIKVKVTPNASKNEVCGFTDDVLKIKINATPEDGKANKELIHFLSKKLKLPKSSISISNGEKSRLKTIVIANCSQELMTSLLSKLNG